MKQKRTAIFLADALIVLVFGGIWLGKLKRRIIMIIKITHIWILSRAKIQNFGCGLKSVPHPVMEGISRREKIQPVF